jgi:hypothetical protein
MGIDRVGYVVLSACLAVLLLSACSAPEPHTSDARSVVTGEQDPPPRWALEKGRAMPLDTGQSRIVIRVYRGGRLAHLGHNHVLEPSDLRGSLKQLEAGGGLAELAFGVAGIVVDDAAARMRAGDDFVQQPDVGAVAGTRRNMLGEKVLDAADWPEVRVLARIENLAAPAPVTEVYVSVRGINRSYKTPVKVEVRDAEARISGTLTVRQSDFGIQPFSVLGGALQVRDEIQADFVIVGHKSGGAM